MNTDKPDAVEPDRKELLRRIDDLKLRNRILRERTDLPPEWFAKRLGWFQKVEQLTAERDALLREVEAARRRGGWTYCEDAFPTKPDEYLITYISIYDGKPASGVAEYVRDEWRYDDGDVFTVPVIAWRPLPEPAEIKRSEDEV